MRYNLTDGVVINFGVKFLVEAHNNVNKADIKNKMYRWNYEIILIMMLCNLIKLFILLI